MTYNALTDNNLLDLASNIAGPGLQRPEAIINPEFRVFWPRRASCGSPASEPVPGARGHARRRHGGPRARR